MKARWRAIRVGPWMTLAVAATGCATMPPAAPSDPAALQAHYASALVGRVALSRALEADIRLWTRLDGQSLPGAAGRVLLAAPDAVRLRLYGVFGAALDGALHDDSLTIHLTARRQGVEVAGLGDSLGLAAPGEFLVRALAATWPAESLAPRADHGSDPAVTLDARGRVQRVTWRAAEGRRFTLDYARWTAVGGVSWPVQWRLASDDGALEVECRLDRLRALSSSDPDRMRVTLPRDVERVAVAALAASLRRVP